MFMAAKKKTTVSASSLYKEKPKKRRPGRHAKTKSSSLKSSKNYTKKYKGQGR
jgi:hypothetical protein